MIDHRDKPPALAAHLPWLGAMVATILVGLKVITVSRFQPETIRALVSSSSLGTILLSGVTLYAMPLLSLAFIFFVTLRVAEVGGPTDQSTYRGAAIFAAILLILLQPWFMAPLTLVLVDALFERSLILRRIAAKFPQKLWGRRLQELKQAGTVAQEETDLDKQGQLIEELQAKIDELSRSEQRLSQRIRIAQWIWLGATSIATLLLLLDTRPWLPAERVTLSDKIVLVGYAISENEGLMTFMRDQDRVVVRIDADKIAGRLLCSIPAHARTGWWVKSPLQSFYWQGSRYPRCSTGLVP